MTVLQWRESKLDTIPEGVWIMGRYPTGYLRSDDPHPVWRDRDYFWIVEVGRYDGGPTIERVDMPPTLWRFV